MSQNAPQETVLVMGSFQAPGAPCGITTAVFNSASSLDGGAYDLKLESTYQPPAKRSTFSRATHGVHLSIRAMTLVRKYRASIVEIHTASGRDFLKHSAIVLAARLAGAHCVLRIHGGAFAETFATSGWLRQQFVRWILRTADRVVVLSTSWDRRIRQIEPRTNTVIIPNSVDTNEYRDLAEANTGRRHVLLLGNLCEAKGHFDALSAFSQIANSFPGVNLLFAGGEREAGAMEELMARAVELRIRNRVEFLGPVSGKEKQRTFARSGILVLPSHVENMPLVIIEAMAAGIPVVATSVGAIPEMVESGIDGLLLEPRDVSSLAKHLRTLLESSQRRSDMGCAARKKAEALWDLSSVAQNTCDMYRSLL